MGQLEDAKRGMLQLPVELLQHILASVPEPRSLAHAIQASRTLYLSFKENKQHIITTVMLNYIGAGLLHEAKLTWVCRPPVLSTKLAEQPDDLDEEQQDLLKTYVADFLHAELGAIDLTGSNWTLGDAMALYSFHDEVVLPLKDRFIQASADTTLCGMSAEINESLEALPISTMEGERICRTLYRFELFRRLFGCCVWRTDELIDSAMSFFSSFSPWEVAQLGCIHDFLGRQVAQVFNDVARHDITWGEFSIMFDADAADGTIQHLLTLGLRKILAIAHLQEADYSEREKLFNPDNNIPPENENFLNSALIEINHLTHPTGDESLYNTVLSTQPSYAEADSGPETMWRLSCPQDGSSLALFERHDWISRRWGYVLWDYARLHYLDRHGAIHLSPPWEPAANPRPESLTSPEQEREASWRIRSSLYARGGRGWWAEGDESKVRWLEERFPSRDEQRTKKEQEEKLRHKPESLEDAKRYWAAELMQRD